MALYQAEVPARYHRVRSSECLGMILHLSANTGACIPSNIVTKCGHVQLYLLKRNAQ